MAVSEVAEDVWTAPVAGVVRHAGHHVHVKVSESFGLREQHHVGLLTSGDRSERHRCPPEQVAERRCLLGGELIKGVDMAKRHQDEPTGETRVEVMGDAPTTVTDEPLTERCVRTGLLACITISSASTESCRPAVALRSTTPSRRSSVRYRSPGAGPPRSLVCATRPVRGVCEHDGMTSDLELALRMLDAADVETVSVWKSGGVSSRPKQDGTPVTVADTAAENAMLATLRNQHRSDGFVGEEIGEFIGTTGRRWIADGIDGTRFFASGATTWGTLLALEIDGAITLGRDLQPAAGSAVVGGSG